jgi:hypothetical protein
MNVIPCSAETSRKIKANKIILTEDDKETLFHDYHIDIDEDHVDTGEWDDYTNDITSRTIRRINDEALMMKVTQYAHTQLKVLSAKAMSDLRTKWRHKYTPSNIRSTSNQHTKKTPVIKKELTYEQFAQRKRREMEAELAQFQANQDNRLQEAEDELKKTTKDLENNRHIVNKKKGELMHLKTEAEAAAKIVERYKKAKAGITKYEKKVQVLSATVIDLQTAVQILMKEKQDAPVYKKQKCAKETDMEEEEQETVGEEESVAPSKNDDDESEVEEQEEEDEEEEEQDN